MLKKLASQTAVYGLSSILARLVNYLLVPLHTYMLDSASDYGTIAYYYSFAALLNVVYTHGMETAFFRFASKKGANQKEIYNGALTSIFTVSLLVSGSILFFSDDIATFIGFPEQAFFVRWFAYIMAIDAILAIPFARLRQEDKAVLFASVRIIMVVANVTLNVFFLYLCKSIYEEKFLVDFKGLVTQIYDPNLGAGYAFYCNLLANALAIPLLYKYFLTWRPTFNLSILKPLWLYGYPLIFSGIAFAINEVLDKILLKVWLPVGFYENQDAMGAVGIYSGCYKLSIFITIAVQAYKYAAEPFFFAKAEDKDSPQAYAIIMKYFIIICCIMMLGVVANIEWLSSLFLGKPEYKDGLGVVPILLLANIFLGIYYNLAVWFKITDRTHFGAYIGAMGAFITLVLNYALIPVIGYFGSAWATLACYSSMALVCYLLGKKYFPIPYHTLNNLIVLSITAIVAFGLYSLNFGEWYINTFIGNVVFIVVLLLIYLKEKNTFKNVWRGNL